MKSRLRAACIIAPFIITSITLSPMHITGYTRDNVQSADAAAGGEWIVLIHGLLSSPRAMRKIKSALVARGYSVLNFGYDSRQQSIRTSAVLLDTEIKRVIPNTAGKIHFVTHSLGSIIARYYFEKSNPGNLGRCVMIAPPNHGSIWGRRLIKNIPFFNFVLGIAGQEVRYPPEKSLHNPPPCEFGIIAGGMGNSFGINPLIPGDNDGTIAVSETRLDGMNDFVLVRGQHTMLLFQKKVIDNILLFLETGNFDH